MDNPRKNIFQNLTGEFGEVGLYYKQVMGTNRAVRRPLAFAAVRRGKLNLQPEDFQWTSIIRS
jgi:hypothetical protein